MTNTMVEEPSAAPTKRINYVPTAVICVVTLFFTAGKGGGLFLQLAIIPLIIWALYNILNLGPGRFKSTGGKLLLWSFTLGVSFSAHAYYRAQAREHADQVAVNIAQYKMDHGNYPKLLAEVGLDDSDLPHRWRISYGLSEHGPFLSYRSTFNLFDSYHYDFDAHKWVFDPD